MKNKVLLIGAGLSNLVLARLFIDNGYDVEIVEKKLEIGGLCADYWSIRAQCWVSRYGPHILHFDKDTSEAELFILNNTILQKYNHTVLCVGKGNITYWPPNNIYQNLYKFTNPNGSFFNEFIGSYSKKMWGSKYKEVLERIKGRFKFKNVFDNHFFAGENVYICKYGFKTLFKNLSKGSKIILGEKISFNLIKDKLNEYDYVFVSSPIDDFYNNLFGKLKYKGMTFEFKEFETDGSSILPTPTVNLNGNKKYIRISEYNQFYDSKSKYRIIGREIPNNVDKIYPINDKKDKIILKRYQDYSKKFKNLYFVGRLGRYKYLDMDETIQNSINLFKKLKGGNN
jgi:UDP-galactopyranose mutase